MQTFLPNESFQKSAKCLDMRRLGKQRVECLQILQALYGESKGWSNHPATKMWKGYENALVEYSIAMIDEWTSRGYKDTCKDKILDMQKRNSVIDKVIYPKWLGDKEFHDSHKSNLLRKKPEHYSQFKWNVPNDLEYIWPN